jgi:hypothetical protein
MRVMAKRRKRKPTLKAIADGKFGSLLSMKMRDLARKFSAPFASVLGQLIVDIELRPPGAVASAAMAWHAPRIGRALVDQDAIVLRSADLIYP